MGISTNPTESSALADALFPKVRQRVLAVLFGTPDRSFYANEVIALAQSGLAQCSGNWPVFAALHGLVLKTVGLAFIYGSVARQQDSAFVTRVIQQPKIWLTGNEELLHAPSA